MICNFNEMINNVKGGEIRTVAVAYAHDPDVLGALERARQEKIAKGILVGPKNKIEAAATSLSIAAKHFEIVDIDDEKEATRTAAQMVRDGNADVLMKGLCSTSTILGAVLDKQNGLRDASLLSHIAAFQVPTYPKLIILSDAAMNIAPDLPAKIAITENAIRTAHRLEIELPKVAIMAAVEKINPENMPCTVDAAVIAHMGTRGQIKNAIIDGPLAVDNAFSRKSCEVKGIKSQVGGDADIIIAPDIEAGNCFYKVLANLALAELAGIIVGAKKPIVLTSRADTDESKFLSIVFAIKVC